MTKNEILAQPLYQEAIKLFVSRSLAFDKAAKDYKDNQNPEKELDLEKNSKSAWGIVLLSNELFVVFSRKD